MSHRDEAAVARLIDEANSVRLREDDFWSAFLPALNELLIQSSPSPARKARARARESSLPKPALQVNGPRHRRPRPFDWLGVLRPSAQPSTERERLILRRLAPALRRRLTHEHQLENATIARAALEVCLESLDRPAVIVDENGQVHLANAHARRLLATDARGVGKRLQDCISGASNAFALTPLAAAGPDRHWLAIEAPPLRDPGPLLASASVRWSLTAREGQALALLAEGLSNRVIAARLECAQRTVEVHVARLLAKSGSASRSQLIVQFWSDGQPEKEGRKTHARP